MVFILRAGQDPEQLEVSYTTGRNEEIEQPLSKTFFKFLVKVNMYLLYDSAVLFIGFFTQEK